MTKPYRSYLNNNTIKTHTCCNSFLIEKSRKKKMGIQETDPLAQLSLPPGFRFYPTDEELMVQYLCRKAAGYDFSLQLIAEIDLYKFDPWVLPSK